MWSVFGIKRLLNCKEMRVHVCNTIQRCAYLLQRTTSICAYTFCWWMVAVFVLISLWLSWKEWEANTLIYMDWTQKMLSLCILDTDFFPLNLLDSGQCTGSFNLFASTRIKCMQYFQTKFTNMMITLYIFEFVSRSNSLFDTHWERFQLLPYMYVVHHYDSNRIFSQFNN